MKTFSMPEVSTWTIFILFWVLIPPSCSNQPLGGWLPNCGLPIMNPLLLGPSVSIAPLLQDSHLLSHHMPHVGLLKHCLSVNRRQGPLPAAFLRESSPLPQNGWLASNTITSWVTFVGLVSAVRSRNKPSSSRTYLHSQVGYNNNSITSKVPVGYKSELFWYTLQGTGFLNLHTSHVTCTDFIWRNVVWILIS
jgi:hypothetical protein